MPSFPLPYRLSVTTCTLAYSSSADRLRFTVTATSGDTATAEFVPPLAGASAEHEITMTSTNFGLADIESVTVEALAADGWCVSDIHVTDSSASPNRVDFVVPNTWFDKPCHTTMWSGFYCYTMHTFPKSLSLSDVCVCSVGLCCVGCVCRVRETHSLCGLCAGSSQG